MDLVKNRSSLARVGLDVSASSYVNPGYHGQMTITIKNMNPNSVVIHSGMRICQLILVDVEPEANIDYSKKEDAKYQEEKRWRGSEALIWIENFKNIIS